MGCGLFVIDDWNCEWYCCCMRLMLFEDLNNECESHAWNLYVYMWNAITNDIDVYGNDDIRWC